MLDPNDVNEGEVVDVVRSLVEAGEYRDELLLRRGLEVDGGGGFLRTPRGQQQIVARDSPQHDLARAAGKMEPLPPLLPASPEAVDEAEATLGHRLPEPLRRLYLEVGNGGFGPGYGLLGVRDGHQHDEGATALDMLRDGAIATPPAVLWPLCTWGCGIYSLVDCAFADGRIWGFDPNPEGDIPEALFPQDITLIA